jgi:hypothetical protein
VHLDGYRQEAHSGAIFRNRDDDVAATRMTFIAKDPKSNPTRSAPDLGRANVGRYRPGALAQMAIPAGETAIEIPDLMIQFFR